MAHLQAKVLSLKLEAVIAARHAVFWQKLITDHGEEKATEFYKRLGLNHLEKKSVTWEGLTLSREPKEHEKVVVKGVSQAQERAKESITKILLNLRTELIADGLKGIKKLKPATYHELTLQASKESRGQLRERLVKVHKQGRLLVAAELGKKKHVHPVPGVMWSGSEFTDAAIWGKPAAVRIKGRAVAGNPFAKKEAQVDEDEFDLLDDLVDLSNSRIANEVQVRITAATARYRLLGLGEAALWKAVEDEIRLGSVSYIDRAGGELSHRVVGMGRRDEMRDRSDSIDHYEYSALLDVSTCENCFPLDGTTANTLDELPEVPLADCLGGGMCRCFIVAIAD